MSEYLETSYDKFTFRVKTGYRYTEDDMWVRQDNGRVAIGVADFLQRRSGDVAFVQLPAVGEQVTAGEPGAMIETIKVAQDLTNPLSGTVVAVNEELDDRPELVNEDPYGEGWLFQITPDDPTAIDRDLLDAESYLQSMMVRVEEEGKKLGR
jgi:glycine cleavage system H protein